MYKRQLLIGHDYPTLHAPFALPGFQRVVVPPEADGTISLDTVRDVMERERPQLVAISEVQWLTGFRIDALGDGTGQAAFDRGLGVTDTARPSTPGSETGIDLHMDFTGRTFLTGTCLLYTSRCV